MTTNYKNAILSILAMMGVFNFVFLIGSGFLVEHFTGDVVLSGNIDHGKILEGNPMLTENKDVTFLFTSRGGSNLHITIVNPDGIEYSWIKKFRTASSNAATTDYTFSFTPKSTGTYCIKISNATYHTDVKVISGMINPTKNVLILVGVLMFWIIIFFSAYRKTYTYNGKIPTVYIAFILSLATTYITIYYSSM